MPVSISIEPSAPCIDMYDSPDTRSAYSLSGQIAISVKPGSSFFGVSRGSSKDFLLSSLQITFEGQSELLNEAGYTSLRLISSTTQLVSPMRPVPISTDDDCRVIFNLTVPGWLPASSPFEDGADERTHGVEYALYASAIVIPTNSDVDDGAFPAVTSENSIHCMWNSLCSFFRFGFNYPRAVHASRVPICLTRYVSPPLRTYDEEELSPLPFPRSLFAVETTNVSATDETLTTNIPADDLGSVQLHAIVPSRTSMDNDSVPLTLRLRRRRTTNVETRNILKVLRFKVNVMQVEEYHTSPTSDYTARFPLPPPEQQPPLKPLKARHPLSALFDVGLISDAPPNTHVLRERTLIPAGTNMLYDVEEADAINPGVSLEDGWLHLDVDVPVLAGEKNQCKRVTGQSPLLEVRHEMRVRLTVGSEEPEGDAMVSDELLFVVPLEFVMVTPPAVSSQFFPMMGHIHAHSTSSLPFPVPPTSPSTPPLSHTRSLASLHTAAQGPATSHPPSPFPPPLPAYSQLFHENGDRKEEFFGALPVYREKVDAPLCAVANPSLCGSTCTLASASSFSLSQPELAASGLNLQRTSLESIESPITPSAPVIPPGLAGYPVRKGAEHAQKFGEDDDLGCDEGLRMEGGGSDRPVEEFTPENEVGPDLADVQYGIAF